MINLQSCKLHSLARYSCIALCWIRGENVVRAKRLLGEYSCISYRVVAGMLVIVTATIIKGVRGFGVIQDTEPVSSMSG